MKLSESIMRPEAEEALENLIKLSAQGARRFLSLNLSGKRTEQMNILNYTFFCISISLFFRPPSVMRAVLKFS